MQISIIMSSDWQLSCVDFEDLNDKLDTSEATSLATTILALTLPPHYPLKTLRTNFIHENFSFQGHLVEVHKYAFWIFKCLSWTLNNQPPYGTYTQKKKQEPENMNMNLNAETSAWQHL